MSTTSRKLLLLEDNPRNIEIIVDIISSLFGEKVSITQTKFPETAMKEISEEYFLVLCDINLGKTTSLGFLDYVKRDRILSKIPIVAVSAHDLYLSENSYIASKFDEILDKPIRVEELRTMIEKYID